MTTPARAPLWLPPLSLFVILVLIAVFSFSPARVVPFAVTGQALLLIVVLRCFCHWPPMMRWAASMPAPHRWIFALLLAGMVLGHYTLNARTFFPYVAWEIFPFVNERDPVTCREFIATTRSGAKVRLLAEQLFPSIVQVDPLESLDDPTRYPPGTTGHLVRAMAALYNQLHPADPVQSVDLMLVAVKLHPPPGGSATPPSCEFLQHYDISPGR